LLLHFVYSLPRKLQRNIDLSTTTMMIDAEGEVYVVGCVQDRKLWLVQLPATAWGATRPVQVSSYSTFDQEARCSYILWGDLKSDACGNNAIVISDGDGYAWYWAVNGSDVSGALATPGLYISWGDVGPAGVVTAASTTMLQFIVGGKAYLYVYSLV
jgi:hypothetical protein